MQIVLKSYRKHKLFRSTLVGQPDTEHFLFLDRPLVFGSVPFARPRPRRTFVFWFNVVSVVFATAACSVRSRTVDAATAAAMAVVVACAANAAAAMASALPLRRVPADDGDTM